MGDTVNQIIASASQQQKMLGQHEQAISLENGAQYLGEKDL